MTQTMTGFGGVFIPLLLTFVSILLLACFRRRRDPRYPPGPPSLPLIGNLFQLGRKPQMVLLKWANVYGPIYSMKMGSQDVIVLNDPKLIKNVLRRANASGRTHNPAVLAFANGNYGVIMSEGANWEQQRRFTLKTLRDFGFAQSAMENRIRDEVNIMTNWLEKRLDKPIPGVRIFNGAVVDSLWHIISSEKTEWDASVPSAMCQCTGALMGALHRINASGLMFAPCLRYLAPEILGWNAWIRSIEALKAVANISIQRHVRELDPNNPHDLIDHYLIQQRNETDPNSSFYKEQGDKNLSAVIKDLFFAGSETTSHTLSWTMLLLAHNQEVQAKLHNELITVVGEVRQPALSDRPNLPYTEAVIMEALRRTSVVNNGSLHKMLEDEVISGYFFPKDTTVLTNIFAVHHDPNIWGDPTNFRPERFLTPDGTKVVTHEAFMPFSAGKRQCIGISLAKHTLFLFTAAIFQKFLVQPDPNERGNAINKITPSVRILNEPEPFNIIVSLR